MEGPDSDSEDPLYSTVKPKSARPQQPSPEQGSNSTNKPPKKLPKIKMPSSRKKLEGVDNVAFEGKFLMINKLLYFDMLSFNH